MMREVCVRGCCIGVGMPKICVPIVARNMREIFSQARATNNKTFDLVEWRADWFETFDEPDTVCRAARVLRGILGDKPILFTFRTKKEGGMADIDTNYYMELNHIVASQHLVDLIDVELSAGDDVVRQMIADAHAANVPVVVSSHDFEKTPPHEELLSRLRRGEELGGDILKTAVMPHNSRDVLDLLSVTEEMSRTSEHPVVTMSMGQLGILSRLSGELFGSAMTFGTISHASAPGQIAVEPLRDILELLHSKK